MLELLQSQIFHLEYNMCSGQAYPQEPDHWGPWFGDLYIDQVGLCLEYQVLYLDYFFSANFCQWDSCIFVSQQKTDNTFVQPISPNFIWSEESSEKFRFALCSTEIQSKLKNFNSNTIQSRFFQVFIKPFFVFGESFLYTLHLFKEDFAAENRISESSI
jgi:hypothetical protein